MSRTRGRKGRRGGPKKDKGHGGVDGGQDVEPLDDNNNHERTSTTTSTNTPRRSNNKVDDQYIAKIVQNGNFRMEAYYAAQGLHHSYVHPQTGALVACQSLEEYEAERLKWRTSLGEVLPASFRIGKDVPPKLRDYMEAELMKILQQVTTTTTSSANTTSIDESSQKEPSGNVDKDVDEAVLVNNSSSSSNKTGLQKLGFLPHAYQLALDRASIRKKPQHSRLHHWLKQQSQAGFITRQETVSMIPPVVLNPQPSDAVLDMCAAPGSKTSQLLEALDDTGCLVANDASFARAHMLTHQLRRILHYNPVALITHGQAQFFPNVVQFDKILCDVPCSGDGTSRKNIDVWQRWSQLGALALHALQFDIAWKACSQLCQVDGYVCYSTCSFNPVENEAVVAELLRRAEGKLELVSVPQLNENGFVSRPGLSTWKVFCDDKTQREVRNQQKKHNPKMQQRRQEWKERRQSEEGADVEANTGETSPDADPTTLEAPKIETGANDPSIMAETQVDGDPSQAALDTDPMESESGGAPSSVVGRRFQPTSYDDEALIELVESSGLKYFRSPEDVPEHMQKRVRPSCFAPTSSHEVESFHLERCIRCLPHDNDTGGFFVALLRKTAPISSMDRRAAAFDSETESTVPEVNNDCAEAANVTAATANVSEPNDDEAPDRKRAKLDSNADGEEQPIEIHSVAKERDDGDQLTGVDKPPRFRYKRNLVRDKDGNAIPELGRDDFVEVPDDIMLPLLEFYGLDHATTPFPRELLMIRAGSDSKVISYIARPVKALFDCGFQKRVTVVTSGLKVFIRKGQDCAVKYRLSQEGVHFLAPRMTKRKFVVNRGDFEVCLSDKVIPLDQLSSGLQEQLTPLTVGSIVIVLDGYQDGEEKMILAKWRCRGDKIDNLVPAVELLAIKDKLHALESLEK